MTELRAFVGHSFTSDDAVVVRKFLDYLEQVSGLLSEFSWVHAESAEPRQLAEKVLSLLDRRNLFIGICTRKEYVIDIASQKRSRFRNTLKIYTNHLICKTSDWIIQEIGVAIGKGLHLLLLVENGVRPPGGLQGNVEYISFDRAHPEEAFGKILEMIRALLPRATVTPNAAIPTAPQTEDQASQGADPGLTDAFKLPQPHWDRRQYEIGLMLALMDGDSETAATISDAYLATQEADENDNAITWRVFYQYRRIVSGDGGKLSDVEAIVRENPHSVEPQRYLALAYKHYGDIHKCAISYQLAGSYATDNDVKAELLGCAAVEYAREGEKTSVEHIVGQIRDLLVAGAGERQLLQTLHEIAVIGGEIEISIASLERTVELDPSDIRSRFALAYAYGDLYSELCLYHYTRIPALERDAITWNNLGVVRDKLVLPLKSVQAYQSAKSKGETLAMSNLALKFASAGFLEEAQRECDDALARENYHQNIGATLAKLRIYPEQENNNEAGYLIQAEPISHFFQQFGRALCEPRPSELKTTWQGPDCELDVVVDGMNFAAKGNYDVRTNALGSTVSFFGTSPPPERWQVIYRGTIRGRAIEARVSRVREGEAPKPTGLLSLSGDGEAKVLMLITTQPNKIRAMEISQGTKPRFYSLTPAGPLA